MIGSQGSPMNPHEPMESACPSETEEAISDEEEDLEGIFFMLAKKLHIWNGNNVKVQILQLWEGDKIWKIISLIWHYLVMSKKRVWFFNNFEAFSEYQYLIAGQMAKILILKEAFLM